jgi:hypothetical protein
MTRTSLGHWHNMNGVRLMMEARGAAIIELQALTKLAKLSRTPSIASPGNPADPGSNASA